MKLRSSLWWAVLKESAQPQPPPECQSPGLTPAELVSSWFQQGPLSNGPVFPHPSLLQPPVPPTPTPVPREPSRKPLSVSPSTDGLRSPSPPPRSCVPALRQSPSAPGAPALSPTRVSSFLLHLLSCCGEAELSLSSEVKAWSDPVSAGVLPAPRPLPSSQENPHLPHSMRLARPICNVCILQTPAATASCQ